MKTLALLLVPLLAGGLSPAPAKAAVVLDAITGATLGGTSANITGPDTAISFFGSPLPFPNNQAAVRFQTGAFPATLDQVDFRLNIQNATNIHPVQVVLSTGATAPGGTNPIVVGTVTPTPPGAFGQTLTVAPPGGIALAANTEYWLHFTTTGSNPFYSIASSDNVTSTGSWALTEVWRIQPPNPWTEIAGLTPAIRLSATETVPEPSAALLGLAGALLLLRRRR